MARKIIPRRSLDYQPSEEHHRKFIEFVQQRVKERHGIDGYDPVLAMALMATDPALDEELKLQLECHKEVAKYWHSQLQRTEVTGADGGPVQVEERKANIRDILQSIETIVKAGKK